MTQKWGPPDPPLGMAVGSESTLPLLPSISREAESRIGTFDMTIWPTEAPFEPMDVRIRSTPALDMMALGQGTSVHFHFCRRHCPKPHRCKFALQLQ